MPSPFGDGGMNISDPLGVVGDGEPFAVWGLSIQQGLLI